jgi:hypothetical protein
MRLAPFARIMVIEDVPLASEAFVVPSEGGVRVGVKLKDDKSKVL